MPVNVAEIIVPINGDVKDGVVPVPTAVPAAALLPKVTRVMDVLATKAELGTLAGAAERKWYQVPLFALCASPALSEAI